MSLNGALLSVLACFIWGFAGFIAGRQSAETHIETRTEAEIVTETVTVFHRLTQKREDEHKETERVIHRKVIIPCKCPKAEEFSTADNLSTGGAVVAEEITERETADRSLLLVENSETAARATMAETQAREVVHTHDPVWRLGAGIGFDWGRRQPVLTLEANRRILGPVSLGVWASSDRHLKGAAGVKVDVSLK